MDRDDLKEIFEYSGVDSYPPRRTEMPKVKVLLPTVLFCATVVTTVIAGALYQGADLLAHPSEVLKGVPFSLSLLLILGTHELGHFIASRRHGVHTTLPVFIPAPPWLPYIGLFGIGTFGAIIRIKSSITTKNALVDIGAAGPLAGFVVAVFVTAIGLKFSTVLPRFYTGPTLELGSSLLFGGLSYLIVGSVPRGFDVMLHPVAFAGWIGFFVTAMNLLPIGQLDGGHILYALLGRRHRIFSILMVTTMVALGFLTWPGWFIWAALIYLIGLWHPPVDDYYVPMDRRRKLTSICALIVFVLTFIPMPFYIA
ncbi:MAG: site-2 protease family protein [Thermodesulfobacteriota bacterium]|nr:MAG: site-2 protease family protein [Thermodesulfobacteriota bacterium]